MNLNPLPVSQRLWQAAQDGIPPFWKPKEKPSVRRASAMTSTWCWDLESTSSATRYAGVTLNTFPRTPSWQELWAKPG